MARRDGRRLGGRWRVHGFPCASALDGSLVLACLAPRDALRAGVLTVALDLGFRAGDASLAPQVAEPDMGIS